jgi:hypothetical protein
LWSFPRLRSLHVFLFLSKTLSRAAFAASLNGNVSRRHGHDSQVGRESLPEHLGIEVRYQSAWARREGVPPSSTQFPRRMGSSS